MYVMRSDILDASSFLRGSKTWASFSTSSSLTNWVTFIGSPYVIMHVLRYRNQSPYSIPTGTIYTGLTCPNLAFAAMAARRTPLPSGSRECMVLCLPSGYMQKRTPCSRVLTMVSVFSWFLSTLRSPSLWRTIGRIRKKCIILAIAGFLNMSARAPNTVGPLYAHNITRAPISVLVWFGARISAPSSGRFSFPCISNLR